MWNTALFSTLPKEESQVILNKILDNYAYQVLDEGCMIVYSGEFYNYVELKEELLQKGIKFKSTSETEVLLESYVLEKEKKLEKLISMYAILIYDIQEKENFSLKIFLELNHFIIH